MQTKAHAVGEPALLGAAGHLRHATCCWHEQVDAAFSRFDLANPVGYGQFLCAHATAAAAAERALGACSFLPPWQRRLPLLTQDLRALGLAAPPPSDLVIHPSEAWHWGMLYVLEGSRLGGSVLLRKIYAGAPNSFLSARHGPGEWREFLALIDQRAAQADGSWVEFATAGASTCFELYQQAASCIIPHMSYSKG